MRIDKKLHNQMKLHNEINWSAVLRKSIVERLKNTNKIDVERAWHAAKEIDEMRCTNVFNSGKSSVEIIREWRDRRK